MKTFDCTRNIDNTVRTMNFPLKNMSVGRREIVE